MESPAQETTELRSSRVSIVIVSQHQIQLLRPTLAALAARSEPELSEVIVVDCGSQDGSARIDDEFEGITVMRLPRNFGWTRAVNIATRTAKSEYLLLVPNGCLIEGDTVQRMLGAIESDPTIGAVCPTGEFYALPKAGETELRRVEASAAQYPFDQLVFNNLASCYNLYDYDKDFKPFKISNREAFNKATGSYPMEELNFVQKILIRSRFVTFIGALKDKIVNRLSGNKNRVKEQEYKMTKENLKQLKDYVKENSAELIVLVIPASDDIIKGKEYHYLNLITILNELSIKYVDPIAQLKEDDYLKIDGGHWKNSGHIKAGHALSKYLLDQVIAKQQTTFKKQ